MTGPTLDLSNAVAPAMSTTGMPTVQPSTVNIAVAPAVGDGLLAAVLSGAVVAAVVTAMINSVLARRSTRLEERARVRSTLAEAYQAYADYKEFPYAIRRRRTDQKEAERIRLSEELRKVQSRISYYQAWTRAESPETGAAYSELIAAVRKIAGGAMHEAWKVPGLENDEGMNIGPDRVDLTDLGPSEEKFIASVEQHVAAITSPWWKRTGTLARTSVLALRERSTPKA
ncbi:hypothetical protein ACFWY5_11430 [Nonomuraea sp. NPDC059007]|uniref:hypothetical protein n=1 Tax=Nonomuraea sp. NPDC059007 TaxID=3346692 RepID=UPI0036926E81